MRRKVPPRNLGTMVTISLHFSTEGTKPHERHTSARVRIDDGQHEVKHVISAPRKNLSHGLLDLPFQHPLPAPTLLAAIPRTDHICTGAMGPPLPVGQCSHYKNTAPCPQIDKLTNKKSAAAVYIHIKGVEMKPPQQSPSTLYINT